MKKIILLLSVAVFIAAAISCENVKKDSEGEGRSSEKITESTEEKESVSSGENNDRSSDGKDQSDEWFDIEL